MAYILNNRLVFCNSVINIKFCFIVFSVVHSLLQKVAVNEMSVTFTTHLARTFIYNGRVITETVLIGPTNVDDDQRTMFDYFCDVMDPRHQLDYYQLKFRPPPFHFHPTGDLRKVDNACIFNHAIQDFVRSNPPSLYVGGAKKYIFVMNLAAQLEGE